MLNIYSGLVCDNNRCIMTMLIVNHNSPGSPDYSKKPVKPKKPKKPSKPSKPSKPPKSWFLQDAFDETDVDNDMPPIRMNIQNPYGPAITAPVRSPASTDQTVLKQNKSKLEQSTILKMTKQRPKETADSTITDSDVIPTKLLCYFKDVARLTSPNNIDEYVGNEIKKKHKYRYNNIPLSCVN